MPFGGTPAAKRQSPAPTPSNGRSETCACVGHRGERSRLFSCRKKMGSPSSISGDDAFPRGRDLGQGPGLFFPGEKSGIFSGCRAGESLVAAIVNQTNTSAFVCCFRFSSLSTHHMWHLGCCFAFLSSLSWRREAKLAFFYSSLSLFYCQPRARADQLRGWLLFELLPDSARL